MAVKRNSGFRSHSRKHGQCLLGISRGTFVLKETRSLSLGRVAGERFSKMAGKLGPFVKIWGIRIFTLREMCKNLWDCCFMIGEWSNKCRVIKTVDFSSVSSIDRRNLDKLWVDCLIILIDSLFLFDNTYDTFECVYKLDSNNFIRSNFMMDKWWTEIILNIRGLFARKLFISSELRNLHRGIIR